MVIDTLKSKVVQYYKEKDTLRLEVLRYFLAAIKNEEIALRPQGLEMNDEVAFKVLKRQIKQTKQAIEMYDKGGRKDLVDKENAEVEILIEFAKLFPYELDSNIFHEQK